MAAKRRPVARASSHCDAWLSVHGTVRDGRLLLSFGFSRKALSARDGPSRLAALYEAALRELVDHCTGGACGRRHRMSRCQGLGSDRASIGCAGLARDRGHLSIVADAAGHVVPCDARRRARLYVNQVAAGNPRPGRRSCASAGRAASASYAGDAGIRFVPDLPQARRLGSPHRRGRSRLCRGHDSAARGRADVPINSGASTRAGDSSRSNPGSRAAGFDLSAAPYSGSA